MNDKFMITLHIRQLKASFINDDLECKYGNIWRQEENGFETADALRNHLKRKSRCNMHKSILRFIEFKGGKYHLNERRANTLINEEKAQYVINVEKLSRKRRSDDDMTWMHTRTRK